MAVSPTDKRKMLEARGLVQQDLRRHGMSLFAISGVINVLALTGSIYMMQVYDRALVSGSVNTLLFISLLAGTFLIFHGAFDALRAQIFVRLGARLDKRLSPVAHRISIDMPRYGFSPTESLERARNVDTLRGFLSGPAPAALFDLPWMLIFIVFVYALHPVLGHVTLAGATLLVLLTVLSEIRSREVVQAAHKSLVERNLVAESNARNADVLVAMGAVDRAVRRFDRQNEEHLDLHANAADVNAVISAISRVLRMLLQSGLLGLGAWLAIQGQLSAGAIMAVSVAAGRALAPIDQVVGGWRNIVGVRHAYVQLLDTLAAMQTPRDRVELPLPKAILKVEGMTVASPANGRVLLTDVSLELKAGQALAIIGPSGGGKSTLMRALSGVWPLVRGTVRLDGVNIAHYGPDQIRQIVGYLPQEVNLFNGTVLENITSFGDAADSEAAIAAANVTGVHGIISSLPEGYDTNVGPNGAALSAGQRQRIGLARALFGTPFLLLLDEPNASLDASGEKALNETIAAIRARGGIVVVVAHRSAVLNAVDMIAVVSGGKIAAFGPRDEILSRQSDRKVVPMEIATVPGAAAVAAADATGRRAG